MFHNHDNYEPRVGARLNLSPFGPEPTSCDVRFLVPQSVSSKGTGRGAGPFLFAAQIAGFHVAPAATGNVSAHVRCALLVLKLARSLWLRRQLKDRSLLSLTEERQEYDLTIRKFQSIVMRSDSLLVHLSKDRRRVLHYFIAPSEQTGRLTGYFV
jgi:hypothetical protein